MSFDKDVYDLFETRLSSVGGHAHHAVTAVDAARVIREIVPSDTLAWASPVVETQAPALVGALRDGGLAVRGDGTPEAVRDQPLGLTIARNAIAETGSCLLVEPTLDERLPSLMTQTLIVLCPSSALLPRLDEAAGVLREVAMAAGSSYATLVTGPSRTADIERQLTVGVQGPGVFHVVFVDDLG